MIFADPPDNIGLKYEGYTDQQKRCNYRSLLVNTFGCIDHCDILWVSFNPNHMALVGAILDLDGFSRQCNLDVRWFMQHVTFGYCMRTDFSRCFRPMIRIMRKGAETYPDAVRIESDRQKQGDKRANPLGKIPSDIWEIPRVTGNSKQRRKWHNTQLNELLYERCLDFSCVPGDLVADIYMGTGTMARAAKGRGLDVDLFDVSKFYCEQVAEEFGTHYIGE
jgi:hypothetical protein